MPRLGRDRGSARDDAREQDGVRGLGGDEDYEWIRYLGEGRTPSSAAPAPARPAAEPMPRRPARPALVPPPPPPPPSSDNGRVRRIAASYDDPAPLPPSRPARGRAISPSGGSGGGRTAFPDDDYDTGPNTLPPSGYGDARRPAPGPDGLDGSRPMPPERPSRPVPGRAVRLAAGRPVDLEAGDKDDLQFNPAAEEYGQPLYIEPAASPSGRPALADRSYEQDLERPAPDRREPRRPGIDRPGRDWPGLDTPMDTSEFVSPLYESRDAAPLAPTRARRSAPGADPFADTDPPLPAPRDRSRRAPQDQPEPLPRRNRAGRVGAQPRIDGSDRFAGREVSLPRRPTGAARAIESPAARTAGLVPNIDDEADIGLRGAAARESAARESRLLDRPRDRRPAPPKSPKREPSVPRRPSAPGRQKAPAQEGLGKAKTRGRRLSRKVRAIGVTAIVVVLAVAGVVLFWPPPSHVISTPAAVGSYTRSQENPTAQALKNQVVTAAPGDVKDVVAAVYKHATGTGAGSPAQIVVFIGGNLTGNASASSLIGAFMADMRGSFSTSPGKFGGRAACAPGSNGGPAECAWADNDTFGVLVSATLSSNALADEMRLMRPLVEHVAK
jgi:hypothetical protein